MKETRRGTRERERETFEVVLRFEFESMNEVSFIVSKCDVRVLFCYLCRKRKCQVAVLLIENE